MSLDAHVQVSRGGLELDLPLGAGDGEVVAVHGPNGVFGPCMHDGPNCSAERTFSHAMGGAGARQRRSPIGGAA